MAGWEGVWGGEEGRRKAWKEEGKEAREEDTMRRQEGSRKVRKRSVE